MSKSLIRGLGLALAGVLLLGAAERAVAQTNPSPQPAPSPPVANAPSSPPPTLPKMPEFKDPSWAPKPPPKPTGPPPPRPQMPPRPGYPDFSQPPPIFCSQADKDAAIADLQKRLVAAEANAKAEAAYSAASSAYTKTLRDAGYDGSAAMESYANLQGPSYYDIMRLPDVLRGWIARAQAQPISNCSQAKAALPKPPYLTATPWTPK